MKLETQKQKLHTITVALFGLILVGGLFFVGTSQTAHAHVSATVARIAGADRYATAIQVSQQLYPTTNSANAVVLANGDNFPSAMTGTPLAYKVGGPILLLPASGITASITTEIERVAPHNAVVYLLGGTSSISDATKNTIEANGFTTRRIYGADRIKTSIEIAKVMNPNDPETVFIVNSNSYVDAAIATSPASIRQYPILLNGSSSLDASVQAYLDARPIRNIYLIGTTMSLSSSLENALRTRYDDADTNVTRLSGYQDEFGTANEVATTFFTGGSPSRVTFVNSEKFPGPLAAGLFAAKKSSPIMPVEEGMVPGEISDYILDHFSQLTVGYVVGGTSSVTSVNETFATNLLKYGDTGDTAAAVGDIACSPDDANYNGGSGTATNCHMQATADLATALNPDHFFALGDLQYEEGSYAHFMASYDTSWGALKAITSPAPGNHEYDTADAEGYYDYFNGVGVPSGPAGNRTEGYYSEDIGDWHVVSLNSNCSDIGGCGNGSAQDAWLEADLAANRKECTMAFWHHPRFSSGPHGSDATFANFWNILSANNATLVLNGHDHMYERFAKQRPGQYTDDDGIREIVVGTGGKSHYAVSSSEENSEVLVDQTYGVLYLRLYSFGYTWKFVDEDENIRDSGSDICS